MTLSIIKDQEGKVFGGVKSVIYFKALLTKEENQLIRKYKVEDAPMLYAKRSFWSRIRY